MVAGRPSPAPLGPVYPAGSGLGGGWGLLWPYRSRVVRWCLDAVKLRARWLGWNGTDGADGLSAPSVPSVHFFCLLNPLVFR